MKDTTLSTCERNFVLKAASELKRLDGRKLEEYRNLKVYFGKDWGSCYVSLGETKVLTQVTCEIQEPKATRPNEGLLFINVELSSMAAPNFETGRASDLSVHINRLLEKCIKDSRAVDLESLCIVAEEKVWVLKVDVNIINHEGSLGDCASISALAALAHFKRPDVTTNGQEIKVHSVSERDPIPITLHHFPVCVSFALLNNSENIFADPTAIEERVSDASLTFGINAYREICCLHMGGCALTKPKLILTCSTRAAARAKEVVEVIKKALEMDSESRHLKRTIGFVDHFECGKIAAMSEGRLKIQLNKYTIRKQCSVTTEPTRKPEKEESNFEVLNLGENCAELTTVTKSRDNNKALKENNRVNDGIPPPRKFLKKDKNGFAENLLDVYGEGGSSKWEVDLKIPNAVDSDSSSDCQEDEICELPIKPKKIENIELSGDSEEEVIVLNACDISNPQIDLRKNVQIPREASLEKSGRSFLKKSSQTPTPDKSKKKKKNRKK